WGGEGGGGWEGGGVVEGGGGRGNERAGVAVRVHRDAADGHASRLELARELPRAGLLLVQHQEVDVPAALLQVRQQLQQVRLGAGDPGHLLHVQDVHRRATRSTSSAQCPTECRSSTAARRPLPVAFLSALRRRTSFSARSRGSSRRKRSSDGRTSSKPLFDASTGMHVAAAS